ncbi:HEAT repeat domain-containing protein [Baaleninema sp.]|uniref:HEAT repeat domain-containing protein n=1 Tax=Baaleninema sp. TaxID=3101197 RepID=UPI003D07ED6C
MTIEQAIANLKQTQDPSTRYYAAWWLGKFRVRENAAIEALIESLSDEIDRSPDGGYPLRRNAAKALGKLGDSRAVPPLIESLSCSDYYVRESAAQALEELRDAQAVPALVKLLEGGVEAAVFVPGKPHLVQPYDAVLEALGALHATETIPSVMPFLEHPVPRVQYAASRALYQLTGDTQYGDRLVKALRERDLQLRRSALMDLGAIGYLDAAKPISETLAENSLKLIALKGILERHLDEPLDEGTPQLDDRAIEVMQYMDRLL